MAEESKTARRPELLDRLGVKTYISTPRSQWEDEIRRGPLDRAVLALIKLRMHAHEFNHHFGRRWSNSDWAKIVADAIKRGGEAPPDDKNRLRQTDIAEILTQLRGRTVSKGSVSDAVRYLISERELLGSLSVVEGPDVPGAYTVINWEVVDGRPRIASRKDLIVPEGAFYAVSDPPAPIPNFPYRKSSLYGDFCSSFIRLVEDLPAPDRACFDHIYGQFQDFRKTLEKEALFLARVLAERYENELLASFNLQRKHVSEDVKQKRLAKIQYLKVDLAKEPVFDVQMPLIVQNAAAARNGNSVQSARESVQPAEGTVQSAGGSVHGTPILIDSLRDEEIRVGRSAGESKPSPAYEETDLPTPSPEVEEVRILLISRLAAKLNDIPSDELCTAVIERMRGAPLASLDERITLKWDKITSFGFILDLADDCAKAFARRQKPPARAIPRPPAAGPPPIDEIRAQWADMTEEERAIWIAAYPELAESPNTNEPASFGHGKKKAAGDSNDVD